MRTLKVMTCGSVDDGKSTFLGRLLLDSESLKSDQLMQLQKSSQIHGAKDLNLAFLTDGLRAEREKGITIDLAYRFFKLGQRNFIFIDSPGHFEFIGNMASAASKVEVALVLIDATLGVVEQTRRHWKVLNLFGVPQVIFCINKMDLVDYSQARFAEIVKAIQNMVAGTSAQVTYHPISALMGDGVVFQSPRMPWFTGSSLAEALKKIDSVDQESKHTKTLFSVQSVYCQNSTSTLVYGRLIRGVISVGDVLLQSDQTSVQVVKIYQDQKAVDQIVKTGAFALPLALQFDGALALQRNSLLCRDHSQLISSKKILSSVLWLGPSESLRVGKSYHLKHVAYEGFCRLIRICKQDDLFLSCEWEVDEPLVFDSFSDNPILGRAILVDPESRTTVAALFLGRLT